MERWRLIVDPEQLGKPWECMATDMALLRSLAVAGAAPVLRLYGWPMPTLSLGYHQDPEKELDLDRCSEDGIIVVRRPTGGRAVLHQNELTYCVVLPSGHPAWGSSPSNAFREISNALARGLRKLEIPAEVTGGTRDGRPGHHSESGDPTKTLPLRPTRSGSGLPCFASVSRWEITAQGHKLVGGAQRMYPSGLLHHGSIPLGAEYLGVVKYLRAKESVKGERLRLLQSCTTDLSQVTGRRVLFSEVAEAIVEGFQEELGVHFQCSELMQDETHMVAHTWRGYLLHTRDVLPGGSVVRPFPASGPGGLNCL